MMSGRSASIVPLRFDFKPGEWVAGGNYKIEKHLGEGSFGDVFKVSDRNGTVWAMKLLRLWDVPSDIRKPLIDRFEMEFKTGRIPSPNLVHSADFGLENGNPYIIMEFCPNGDLTSVIGKADADIPRYAKDILHGLRDLHSNGKVHRDLKPENVLLKADGTAVLTDFGISGDRNKRMTERSIFGKPYQVFGTYAYMPPEQVNRARGESTVLPTTDIFSFGVVIFQIITGALPFGKLDDQNDLVRYQKRGKACDWDRGLLLRSPHGSEWEELIDGCLAPDYKSRIQNADEALRLVPQYTGLGRETASSSPSSSRTRGGGHILTIMQGQEFGRVFDIDRMVRQNGRRLIKAGRSDSNDIQLKEFDEAYTSRWHFTLEQSSSTQWNIRDGQWSVESRSWRPSSNGTYVNSEEVSTIGLALKAGDIITAGDIKLKFNIQ